jgi:hypothetical protein
MATRCNRPKHPERFRQRRSRGLICGGKPDSCAKEGRIAIATLFFGGRAHGHGDHGWRLPDAWHQPGPTMLTDHINIDLVAHLGAGDRQFESA